MIKALKLEKELKEEYLLEFKWYKTVIRYLFKSFEVIYPWMSYNSK